MSLYATHNKNIPVFSLPPKKTKKKQCYTVLCRIINRINSLHCYPPLTLLKEKVEEIVDYVCMP